MIQAVSLQLPRIWILAARQRCLQVYYPCPPPPPPARPHTTTPLQVEGRSVSTMLKELAGLAGGRNHLP